MKKNHVNLWIHNGSECQTVSTLIFFSINTIFVCVCKEKRVIFNGRYSYSAASRGDTCLKFTQSIFVSLLISVSPTRSEQWGKMQVQHVLWLADASAGRPRHDLRGVQTIMTAARNRIAVATWFICRWGGADGVKTALFPTPQTVRFSTIRWTLRECRRLEESFFLRVTQQSYSNLQCNSIIQREQVTDRTRCSLIKLQHRAAHAQCPVFYMSCSFRNKHDHPWSLVFTCINDLQWRSFEVFLVQHDSHRKIYSLWYWSNLQVSTFSHCSYHWDVLQDGWGNYLRWLPSTPIKAPPQMAQASASWDAETGVGIYVNCSCYPVISDNFNPDVFVNYSVDS